MGQWKDMPNELVLQIIKELKFYKGPWCSANKQLYTTFQSIEFENVSIDLKEPNKSRFYSILNSSFKPGLYVKRVYFNELTTPLDVLDTINPNTDPLYQLIKHTPNVKEVLLSSQQCVIEWDYLAQALKDKNKEDWKLTKLPYLVDESYYASVDYYLCACRLKESLTKLDLRLGMINSRNGLEQLAIFKQVTYLSAGDDFFNNVYHCISLFKHLPQLKILEVRGSKQRTMINLGTERVIHGYGSTTNDSSTIVQNNIKQLSLNPYQPITDNELLYIMNNYTNLFYLKIEGLIGISWPLKTISNSVMVSFIQYVLQCKHYNTTFGGVSGEDWLVKSLFEAQQQQMNTAQNVNRGLELSFTFNNKLVRLDANQTFELCLLEEPFIDSFGLAYYYRLNDMEEYESKIQAHLNRLHPSIASINLVWEYYNATAPSIGKYLPAVLNTPHALPFKLSIYRGKLEKDTGLRNLTTPKEASSVRQLKFTGTEIKQNALPLLFLYLSPLDYLRFEKCEFDGDAAAGGGEMIKDDNQDDDKTIHISMPNTAVTKLRIDLKGKIKKDSPVLFSVLSLDKGIMRYHHSENPEEDPAATEITQEIFDQQLDTISHGGRMVVLYIYAKNIESIILKAFLGDILAHRRQISLFLSS